MVVLLTLFILPRPSSITSPFCATIVWKGKFLDIKLNRTHFSVLYTHHHYHWFHDTWWSWYASRFDSIRSCFFLWLYRYLYLIFSGVLHFMLEYISWLSSGCAVYESLFEGLLYGIYFFLLFKFLTHLNLFILITLITSGSFF